MELEFPDGGKATLLYLRNQVESSLNIVLGELLWGTGDYPTIPLSLPGPIIISLKPWRWVSEDRWAVCIIQHQKQLCQHLISHS